ncbi:MAG: hypothetical protein GYA24_08555 [Candidatus Lokiarchaeota archaeon]|nr:hypothetical protein [Candidatus Lokiarchaeota archaeon]
MDESISNPHRLTRYLLWSSEETVKSKKIPLPMDINDEFIAKHKYMLGIFAPSKEFLKITTYYLDASDVSKITFFFDKIDDDIVKKVSLVIKDIPESPIHVSGFCIKQEKYIYELYLKGKKNEATRIVALVKKHVPSFQASIEEISLTTLPRGEAVGAARHEKPSKRSGQ